MLFSGGQLILANVCFVQLLTEVYLIITTFDLYVASFTLH